MQSTCKSQLLSEPLQKNKNKTLLSGESQLLNLMWNLHEYIDRLHTWKLINVSICHPQHKTWVFMTICHQICFIYNWVILKDHGSELQAQRSLNLKSICPSDFSHFTSFTNQQWICTPQNIKTPPMRCTIFFFWC